jgi:hypothetical protein
MLHVAAEHPPVGCVQSMFETQPTQFPAPSHTLLPPQLVPEAAGAVPHFPAMHVRERHSFPVAGQSVGTVH